MGLRMKSFNIVAGSLKNPIFRGAGGGRGAYEKPVYRGNYLKRGAWSVSRFKGRGAWQKEGVVFLRGLIL